MEFSLADWVWDGAGLRRAFPFEQVHNRRLLLPRFHPLTFSCLSPSRGRSASTVIGAASCVPLCSLGRPTPPTSEWGCHAAWARGALQPRCHERRFLWDGVQNDIGEAVPNVGVGDERLCIDFSSHVYVSRNECRREHSEDPAFEAVFLPGAVGTHILTPP